MNKFLSMPRYTSRFHLTGFSALSLLFLFACGSDPSVPAASTVEPSQAQRVVDAAIAAHGSDKLSAGRVAFDFRDRHYVAERRGGIFQYERIFTDSLGRRVRDVLTNEGLLREVEGEAVPLSPKDSAAYANSVNSVIYFALLPYFLNDPAVRKEYLGEEKINGKDYHRVQVTFRAAGGGKDHDDEFVYWFDQADHTMDYFAYNYLTDGGGARFREAYNWREIGGVRFADYRNFQPMDDSRAVGGFAARFAADSLELLSLIELENVTFRPINDNPS